MQWAINSQVPELIERVSQGYSFYKNKRLCSLHFERPCFMNDLKLSLTKLAIPTIFTENPTESNLDSPSSTGTNIHLTKLDTNCEHKTEEVQQLNSNKTKLHFTLAEIIAETVGLDKNQCSQDFFYDDEDLPQLFSETNGIAASEELHAADIDLPKRDPNTDPSESTQAFYQNGKTMFVSVASPAIKNHFRTETVPSVKERTALLSKPDDTFKDMLCRLCAKLECMSQMVHIFGKSSASKEYLHKMKQLLPSSEQPVENDRLPKWICNVCCERLHYCDQALHDFISTSVKLNRLLSTTLSKKHTALMEIESTSTGSSSKSATSQSNGGSVEDDPLVIKEEYLSDDLFEERFLNLIHHSTKQQHTHATNSAMMQQKIQDNKSMPHDSQKGKLMKLCSTNSALANHSLQCTCFECIDAYSEKCSRLITTAHMSGAKYEINVIKKPQTISLAAPSESQDCSFSESILSENIEWPIKRKSHQFDNEVRSTSMSASPKFIKMEQVEEVNNAEVSKCSVANKHHLLSSTSSCQAKKLKQVGEQEECKGKIIQSSHTIIPTASDNKTFLCKKCDISFSSIESALTHRFKEHPEEILCT